MAEEKPSAEHSEGAASLSPTRLERVALRLEGMNLAEYARLFDRPARLMLLNFLAGLARGLGAAVGFAVLSALLVYVLHSAVVTNLPVVGQFLADIVRLVQFNLRVAG